jgi:cell division protein FtsI/penicillin-binding protein 2
VRRELLDVDTGRKWHWHPLPEFDPNKIDAAGVNLMFNRAAIRFYELGSTFKPLVCRRD